MTAETTNRTGFPQLHHNSLGLSELLLHGITHIAPATNIILTFPVIALKARLDMPISFLLTTVVCCFILLRPWPHNVGICMGARHPGDRPISLGAWFLFVLVELCRMACAGAQGALVECAMNTPISRNHLL